ncbi:MBL fold metallo-hydrolase [Paracoccus aerodenitrificans]|uniref:MBL fold metallo-hydrolase n=1 Tax=Paracoccus aerodenitrificans TaxID=3017781 RepID=UPI0022F05810|nr:MBL fold metallo-hydrolase [Paracoccus aerodenitrificans]WBU62470.1 MBL fold metallo-hydrolase [Paracoccus aerodenitrificans]
MNPIEMEILVPGNSLSFRGGFFGFSVIALIRHPELGPVLFDTGHHATRHQLLAGLERANLSPGDIRHVFLSHLHFDHMNNVELFPEATFHVSQSEWAYAKAPHPQDLFGSPAICAWLATRDLRFVGESGDLAAGLRFRHAPGHTPGMTLLAFEGPDGQRIVVAGDACKTYRELVTGDAGEAFDPLNRSPETLQWIRDNADVIVCGHHPVLRRQNDAWAWEEPSRLDLIVR